VLQDFAKTIRLDAGPDAVWDAVNDVRRVASWVSIVREVRDVDPPRRYAALLEDRLGPFAMRADLDIAVERGNERPPKNADGRRMRVTAIRKKGDKILAEFFDSVAKELGGRGPTVEPVQSPSS
jgi:carbon monoxide dehydrogenase subunit G